MGWWNSLPEWLRWILCWPVIVGVYLVPALMILSLSADMFDFVGWVSEVAQGVLVSIVQAGLLAPLIRILMKMFIPRRQDIVSGVVLGLGGLLSLMSAMRWYYEITEGLASSGEIATDMTQVVTGLAVWGWLFVSFRNDRGRAYGAN